MSKLRWWRTACAVALLCAATRVSVSAQTFTTLVNFNGGNGSTPYLMSLCQGTDGNLYGTTETGGANGQGTVFKMTPTGLQTTLYNFDDAPGATPLAGLVLGTDLNFYGTTYNGGHQSHGTVFKITPSGSLTTLYSFCSQAGCADGADPWSALVQATDGAFYGTTAVGGANGQGTVFKITSEGALTILHSFAGYPTEGGNPFAGLVQATDGNFYGTTMSGGAFGYGTVFKITSAGALTTLYSFNLTDGRLPSAALLQGSDGNFYGTTLEGGVSNSCTFGCGTVFKISLEGALTTLHSFDSTDGAEPQAPLAQATDGNLYGTTVEGGANNSCGNGCGTIFRITLEGTLKTLHNFDSTDGSYPLGALVQATGGTFYGTTTGGGTGGGSCYGGCGTVFSAAVGLGPFVTTLPTARKVGQGVIILGTNLTGTARVTFNGTAAVFTVVSATEIATTVPFGATTGTVRILTPDGALNSDVAFRVLP